APRFIQALRRRRRRTSAARPCEGEGEIYLERGLRRSATERRNRNANRGGNQEMKPAHLQNQGFTMIEIMLAVAIGSLMLAATMAASICLQRSFNAVDNYFSSHVQQVRIIDY